MPRLDRLAQVWLARPDQVPPPLKGVANLLEDLVRGRGDLEACLQEVRLAGSSTITPIGSGSEFHRRILGHHERVSLMASRLRKGLMGLEIPLRTILEAVVATHGRGTVELAGGPASARCVALDPEKAGRELCSTLVQLVENSLQAGASRVVIHLSVNSGTDTVTLEVRDDGKGMTPVQMDAAFKREFTTRAGGSGTGLCEAARVVRSLGGTIGACHRDPGPGLVVRLELPASFRRP